MHGIIDFLISIVAGPSMLLESCSSAFFWKSLFLLLLGGLIIKLFSQQMNPRIGPFLKK
jgi:hypothetical protein